MKQSHKPQGPGEYDFLRDLPLSQVPGGERLFNMYRSWLDRYPACAKESLGSIKWLDGAWFQLLIHELLLQLGCKVEVKDVDNAEKIPDFLAKERDRCCYVEVTTSKPTHNIAEVDKNYEDAKHRLNKLNSSDFRIHLMVHGKMTEQLSNKELLGPFRKLLDTYDKDKFIEYVSLVGNVPSERIIGKDWWLLGKLVPVPEEITHGSSPDLIVDMGGGSSGDASPEVMNVLLKKSKHYGTLDAPFVLAINVLDYRFDEWAEVATLFGSSSNGVWGRDGNKPRYTRLTGVLFFRDFFPWSPRGSACLYLNPFANKADLPEALYKLPHASWKDESVHRVEGMDIGDLLTISPRANKEMD